MQRRHHRPGLSTDWDLEDDLELSPAVGDHLAPGDHRGRTRQALDDEEAVQTGDVWVGDEDDEEVPRVRGLLIAPADGMSLEQQESIRRILLALACMLAIGSHYGAYLLGPLKHSLKTSEGNFSSLISSFELSNTITPLISGLLVPKYGAARVGLFSTAIVLCGLLLVVYGQLDDREGGGVRSVDTMISGLFIFGLGLAPIAVVQESIILRHNTSNSTTMAGTVAIGLLLGKFSAFLASITAQPLSTISPRLPFIIATFLAMFSFLCCLLYSMVERTLPAADPREQLKDDHGRWVPLSESTLFGDFFWFYIAVCFLAGGWYSTIHLSTSLLMSIYQITESQAASSASQILFSSTLVRPSDLAEQIQASYSLENLISQNLKLYPVIGWALDRRPSILARLYMAVPLFISATYIILLSLTSVVPHYLALTPSAIGIGGGPLLLVVVIPRIVERHQTSTALGLHKSLEMAGAVISQTITAAILSTPHSAFESPKGTGADKDRASALFAVSFLLLFCELQLGVIIWWWTSLARFERDRSDDNDRGMEYGLVPTVDEDLPSVDSDRINSENELHPELEDHVVPSLLPPSSCHSEGVRKGSASAAETRRGVWALRISLLVVAISWVAFGGNLVWG